MSENEVDAFLVEFETKLSEVQQKKRELGREIKMELSAEGKQGLVGYMICLKRKEQFLKQAAHSMQNSDDVTPCDLQKRLHQFEQMVLKAQEKKNEIREKEEIIREMKEETMQQKTLELQKQEEELEQKIRQVQMKKEELEQTTAEIQEIRNRKLELLEKELLERSSAGRSLFPLQEQEAVHADMRDVKSALLALQQEVARITSHLQDASSSYSDSSVVTADSWIPVGSTKPCCFLPETHFQVVTDDGQKIFAPASMLHQGAKVQSATGKVVEVVHPPEQHQVDSVIELKAGSGSLVVSPDHRVLVPGNTTVKAQELRVGDEVILDGTSARLTSCEWKPGKTLVIRLGFKPDLPVAVSIRFARECFLVSFNSGTRCARTVSLGYL